MSKSNLIIIIIFVIFALFVANNSKFASQASGSFKKILGSEDKGLDYWSCGCNILKMSPRQAKRLISKSGDKAKISIILTDLAKKLDRLDEMDPGTVGEIFKYHPDKDKNIDWANERYDINYSILEWRIKSINKL